MVSNKTSGSSAGSHDASRCALCGDGSQSGRVHIQELRSGSEDRADRPSPRRNHVASGSSCAGARVCREEGLALTFSDVAGLSKGMEALLGGSVDVAASTSMLIIQLAAEGRDVRCFITFYTFPNYALVVAPAAASTIHSVADLKGRRVGVNVSGLADTDADELLTRFARVVSSRREHGDNQHGAASLAAIERGQVDAAAVVGSAVAVLEQRSGPHDPGRRAYSGGHGGSLRIEDFSERIVDLDRDLAESERRHGQAARAGDAESDGVDGRSLRGRRPDADPRGAPDDGCGRRSASDPAGPTESVPGRRDAARRTRPRAVCSRRPTTKPGQARPTFRSSIRTNSCAGRESPDRSLRRESICRRAARR